jgi:HEAT repeat protein
MWNAPDSDQAETLLVRLAHDRDFDVRRNAIQSLGHIRPLSESTLQFLVRTLEGDDDELRRYVPFVFHRQGETAKVVVKDLIKLLDSRNGSARNSACWCLAGIGPSAAEALEPLRAMAQGTDEFDRKAARNAIDFIAGQAPIVH